MTGRAHCQRQVAFFIPIEHISWISRWTITRGIQSDTLHVFSSLNSNSCHSPKQLFMIDTVHSPITGTFPELSNGIWHAYVPHSVATCTATDFRLCFWRELKEPGSGVRQIYVTWVMHDLPEGTRTSVLKMTLQCCL